MTSVIDFRRVGILQYTAQYSCYIGYGLLGIRYIWYIFGKQINIQRKIDIQHYTATEVIIWRKDYSTSNIFGIFDVEDGIFICLKIDLTFLAWNNFNKFFFILQILNCFLFFYSTNQIIYSTSPNNNCNSFLGGHQFGTMHTP